MSTPFLPCHNTEGVKTGATKWESPQDEVKVVLNRCPQVASVWFCDESYLAVKQMVRITKVQDEGRPRLPIKIIQT